MHTHSGQDSKVKFSLQLSSVGEKRVGECVEARKGWVVTTNKCNKSVFWRCTFN